MLGAWLVLLVLALGVSSAVGTRQATGFSLQGTEAQRAQDVLARDFPAQAETPTRSSSTLARAA